MRQRTTSPLSGSILASAVAGPVAVLAGGLVAIVSNPAPIAPQSVAQFFAIGGFLLIPAALVALLPNLIGTALMLWIGGRIEITRLPIVWALVGAAALGVPLACCDGMPGDGVAFVGAMIGATCAAICRIGAYWPDEAAPPRPSVSTTPTAIITCPAK